MGHTTLLSVRPSGTLSLRNHGASASSRRRHRYALNSYVHVTSRGPFKRDQDVQQPCNLPARADDIKRQMEEWRRRNPGRDFGKEM